MNVASRSPHETSNPDVGCVVRMNPWHRYITGPTKTEKAANKPTTSTATKSASRER